jgi:hypothetical protein
MILKNYSRDTVAVPSLGLTAKPGETVTVEDGYCRPRLAVPGTAAQEPVIRLLAPQLEPADESLREAWRANRPLVAAPVPPPPTATDLEATGMSPGVAALAAVGGAATAPPPPHRTPAQPGGKGR